jgi:hypothetical protein
MWLNSCVSNLILNHFWQLFYTHLFKAADKAGGMQETTMLQQSQFPERVLRQAEDPLQDKK